MRLTDVSQTTRVVVVCSQTLLRQGMTSLLEGEGDFRVVAHTGSCDQALKLVGEVACDLVIVDADLADTSLPQFVEAIEPQLGDARLLVVGTRAGQMDVEAAISTGRAGYTLKDVGAHEFCDTARRVAEGEVYLHPHAAAALAKGIADGRGGRPMPLTARQLEILRMLAMGLENKQIARRLGIGVHTVKTHVSRIIRKLGVSTRTEAAVIATKRGMVDDEVLAR